MNNHHLKLESIQEDSIDQILVKNEHRHQHEESYHDQNSNFRNKSEIQFNRKKDDQEEKNGRKKYDKWTEHEKKTFWFGLMAMVQENPLVKHSWGNWKVDKCFKKMEKLFGGNKDYIQIKSYDQRMKKYYKKLRGIDIQEAICQALRTFQLSPTQMKIIENFEAERCLAEDQDVEEIKRLFDQQILLNEREKAEITKIIDLYFFDLKNERNERVLKF